MALAPAVRDHQTTLLEATRAGLFQALGRGSVDISGAVGALEERGYSGWYVLEQDTTIAEPVAGAGTAPVDPAADVKASIEYLQEVAAGGPVRLS